MFTTTLMALAHCRRPKRSYQAWWRSGTPARRILVLLLNKHDHPGVGGYVALHLVVVVGELVIGLIEAYLQLLQFLTVVTDVT